MHRLMIVLLFVTVMTGSSVRGDEVVLESGGTLVGAVREEGETVTLEMFSGTATFSKEKVKSINKVHRAPIEEYYERLDALGENASPADHLELAIWAKEHRGERLISENFRKVIDGIPAINDPALLLKLGRDATERLKIDAKMIWKRLLDVDPDNEDARRGLGFKQWKGQWVTEAEFHAAQGHVLFEGKWMTPEERDFQLRVRTLRLEERAEELKRREREAERKEEEVERREQAARDAEEETERARRDIDAREREIARRERRVDDQERDLRRLTFCPACGGHHCGIHHCPEIWFYCDRCKRIVRRPHRCP